MSEIQEKILQETKKAFPNFRVESEWTIRYAGQTLRFDIYVPDMSLVIEVQGKQHREFNKFFYENEQDFLVAKRRDGLKKEWAELNEITHIEIWFDEVDSITPGEILRRMANGN